MVRNSNFKSRPCEVEGCDKPRWSGGKCKQHTPFTPIPPGRWTKKSSNIRQGGDEMKMFFLKIWNKRPHKSEIDGTWLGNEPLSIFFHHILPKNKYPELAFEEENIILLTGDQHSSVEANPYKYEKINYLREKLKLKFNIT